MSNYKIKIEFEDKIEPYNIASNGINMIYSGFPSICRLSMCLENDYIYNFECLDFKFDDLGLLNKKDLVEWLTEGYSQKYLGKIEFKLASREFLC
jgi:hypothetical protein